MLIRLLLTIMISLLAIIPMLMTTWFDIRDTRKSRTIASRTKLPWIIKRHKIEIPYRLVNDVEHIEKLLNDNLKGSWIIFKNNNRKVTIYFSHKNDLKLVGFLI